MDKYLPLGTIVVLKGGTKKIMIYGRQQYQLSENQKLWDYVGCLYPEGFISDDYNIFFNQEEVQTIVFNGYEDSEELEFQTKIDKFKNSLKFNQKV